MSFLNFSLGGKKNKISKIKNNVTPMYLDSKPLFLTPPYVTHMLVKGNFKTLTQLPKYVDINEWLAFNTFEFFNHLNMFYGSITDFCTPTSCPTMSAGFGVEYPWIDGASKKIKLCAPQYIDYMASSIQNMMNDESLFPTKSGSEFSPEFCCLIKRIFGQLFRLFGHIYHHHYDKILSLHEEPHLNSLFAHFISFAQEFDLLEKKEIQPLQELMDIMMREGIIS
ncbi:Mob1/phocein [Gilbertella persicaria]|uniref:Mob1/phocein n=1 Tax=Gilbertella persicaria TaxID=101096 RepID=UPI00222010D7|nr:Mob1/phocein [Gilbertella persicaria]KAI8098225.1 Mob1/phocein [Gilbertella persicaria]